MQTDVFESHKWREAMAFIVLAVLIWPVIAAAIVGAYGLAFWSVYTVAAHPARSMNPEPGW